MSFKPSTYQQKIFTWVQSGAGHAVVEAVAGSGKTTTAVQAMNLIDRGLSIGFFAFNKSIATELAAKAPAHASVMTLNSLGHRAWGKRAGRVNLSADKTRNLIRDTFTDAEFKAYGMTVKKLVGLCKSFGLITAETEGAIGLGVASDETLEGLVDHYDLDWPETIDGRVRALELTRRVLTLGAQDWQTIDFDDQLYMTVIFGARPPRFDWIFVDEAQDLSPIQHKLIEMALAPGGRIMAIGDSRQAIYGFRGADASSMKNFTERMNAVTLELSICYRCPKSHVELAQAIVPQIEAAQTADNGTIGELGEKWGPKDFTNTDLIICRNSAPLVKAAYRLLSQRMAVRILGRDIGAGLINLIKKLKPQGVDGLRAKVNAWADKEIMALLAKDPEADVTRVEDRRDTVLIFTEMFPKHTVDGICREIESLFSENTAGILTLATVHKAKGLEADRVFILNHWLMPSRAAKKEWELTQEDNLRYVAYTRAKKHLGFIDIDQNASAVQ